MKKLDLIIACIMIFNCFNVNAQHNVNKNKYDYRHYIYQPGDPYNPGTAAFASLFVPGLGQIICGEGLRGTGFLIGFTGSLVVSFAGLISQGGVRDSDPNYYQEINKSVRMIRGGLVGAAVFWIWSIADAPRVAKKNNLILRDKKKVTGNLNIRPYLNFQGYSTNNKTLPGFSVNINF